MKNTVKENLCSRYNFGQNNYIFLIFLVSISFFKLLLSVCVHATIVH